jgi:hypothetical protein
MALQINWLAVLSSAIIPTLIGYIWYGPLLGKQWRTEAGLSLDQTQKTNMVKLFGIGLLFSIFFAVALLPTVLHQMHVGSSLANQGIDQVDSDAKLFFNDYMMKYGNEFRTFKHGAFHGLLTTIFLILPVIGMSGIYEQKSWKYIFIHVGYWAICAMLMGGIISAYA